MHIISISRLKEFWTVHPNSEPALRTWYKLTSLAQWQHLAEVRQNFNSADSVGNFTVFNIGGNHYRLITYIDYQYKKVFIRYVLTHKEYSEEKWKQDDWYQ
ncbi:type II toxin-antitoxin system HigB family toxin [Desertifilum sp. FACHB-1129]|uniref:Addiction module toxin RelE n=1 Tax=Desertifilum tharense IPPAS B-1220 TaxID=1781255 RepID=A0A1E5QJR5_9CYAN|nr:MULTISPECIES: type II toxin-antitoxin system HigB family toxin [Desertifilum]MDA0211401.1 type II toxin-antitoxin system HigB family toxin [Cyanobacteria bacterium FC1]MBD2313554.1 type II toxin-antitoxin system HigB family toxin [Desertifilum sp. FACHB-1129]MBD2323886.1 type II toxin-antitoxin system HigB family toxin [Desertifilum sp. FACHB-866]MBD2333731.1 type II toxin-antitoxin system HigB family toxin [Desertifilum sp. FACHB-868]OEJ74925.1 hypothetical protein BH720_11940 [Desertifilu